MNKCIVLYEDWQMKCCGEDFSVNSKIEWLVCNGSEIKLPIKTDDIDYYYEAHSSDYKNLFVLEGNIKEIKAFYQKYEPTTENPKRLVGVDGILYDIKSSRDIVDNKENMAFSAYLVYIENFSIRPALENEAN
ncbi:MAG: hypothetical protein PUB08_06600 [Firmicutes bacterium]|nr:hypothetical protein [Bacillota bacterium]